MADANNAYTLENTEHLQALDELSIGQCVPRSFTSKPWWAQAIVLAYPDDLEAERRRGEQRLQRGQHPRILGLSRRPPTSRRTDTPGRALCQPGREFPLTDSLRTSPFSCDAWTSPETDSTTMRSVASVTLTPGTPYACALSARHRAAVCFRIGVE